jgi:hypothetical protein
MRRLLLLILLSPVFLAAQNLVRNPGFEQKAGCPDKPGQANLASYWSSPNVATPDYFNDCSPGLDYGTEFNKKGGQMPHSGHGYAGLQFYLLNRNEFYEYLQNRLDSALVPGGLYCVSAYVSLGDANYGLKELDAVLSATEIKSTTPAKIRLPYTRLGNGEYLLDREGWMCIRGIYTAKGGEKLLTIGDFSPGEGFWDIRTQSANDSLFKSTYYFIDDVSVEAIRDPAECKCADVK